MSEQWESSIDNWFSLTWHAQISHRGGFISLSKRWERTYCKSIASIGFVVWESHQIGASFDVHGAGDVTCIEVRRATSPERSGTSIPHW